MIRSGLEENYPYSLSRWTDVPCGAKWEWFKKVLTEGKMEAFDPLTGVPSWWSLAPEDTLGLVFWTKDPSNLISSKVANLDRYRVKVHMTATGWEEVEKGAPNLKLSLDLMFLAVNRFGADNVRWRFSPVPLVKDVLDRFQRLAEGAVTAGLSSVYLSFLQENDRIPETRGAKERIDLLGTMAEMGRNLGIKLYLCNEDRLLADQPLIHPNLTSEVCAPPEDFELSNRSKGAAEGCGCALMVDPFTRNEMCSMACLYCYAADLDYSKKKRNTTKKGLPLL